MTLKPRLDDDGALRCGSCKSKLGQVQKGSDHGSPLPASPLPFTTLPPQGSPGMELVLVEDLYLEAQSYDPSLTLFQSLIAGRERRMRFGPLKSKSQMSPASKRTLREGPRRPTNKHIEGPSPPPSASPASWAVDRTSTPSGLFGR